MPVWYSARPPTPRPPLTETRSGRRPPVICDENSRLAFLQPDTRKMPVSVGTHARAPHGRIQRIRDGKLKKRDQALCLQYVTLGLVEVLNRGTSGLGCGYARTRSDCGKRSGRIDRCQVDTSYSKVSRGRRGCLQNETRIAGIQRDTLCDHPRERVVCIVTQSPGRSSLEFAPLLARACQVLLRGVNECIPGDPVGQNASRRFSCVLQNDGSNRRAIDAKSQCLPKLPVIGRLPLAGEDQRQEVDRR